MRAYPEHSALPYRQNLSLPDAQRAINGSGNESANKVEQILVQQGFPGSLDSDLLDFSRTALLNSID